MNILVNLCCFVLFPYCRVSAMFPIRELAHKPHEVAVRPKEDGGGGGSDAPDESYVPDSDFFVYWFEQKLDHFLSTDTRTWTQRYYVNYKHYNGRGPVFLFVGGLEEIEEPDIREGAWIEYAKAMGAMIFYVEHRFYGQSHPTRNLSTENLVYLNSEQALADLAWFIVSMRLNFISSIPINTRWIAFGATYGGTLAARLRLKYPNLIYAAVTSSAPLLEVENFCEYFMTVEFELDKYPDVKEKIQEAFKMIHAKIDNYDTVDLEEKFNLCTPLEGKRQDKDQDDDQDEDQDEDQDKDQDEDQDEDQYEDQYEDHDEGQYEDQEEKREKNISYFFWNLSNVLALILQYGNSELAKLKKELMKIMITESELDALDRFASAVKKTLKFYDAQCLSVDYDGAIQEYKVERLTSELPMEFTLISGIGIRQNLYQRCTEFGQFETSDEGSLTGDYFPLAFYVGICTEVFGDKFDSHRLSEGIRRTSILYGGLDIEVSRIIFVTAGKDPWNVLGFTKSKPINRIAIYIENASQCDDLRSAKELPGLRYFRSFIFDILIYWLWN